MKKITIIMLCCLIFCACASLTQGVQQNDEIAVENALNKGSNPNIISNDGTPILILATNNGAENIVKLLIEAGADVNVRDKDGWTALMRAAERHNNKIAQMLIDAGANLNVKGQTQMEKNYMPCVGFHCPSYLGGSFGITALMIACQSRNEDLVHRLLAAGANTDIRGDGGDTALIQATRQKYSLGIVKMLIDAGADINIKNNYGKTALNIAIQNEDTNTEKAILSSGATLPDGSTSLIIAILSEYTDVVKEIIARGVDVNVKNKRDNRTALMFAAQYNYPEIVKDLIAAGADVNAQDIDGETALQKAKENDYKEIVKLLKAAGAR